MENYKMYQRRFLLAMVVYAIVLIATVSLIRQMDSLPVKVVLAILPIAPIIYGLSMAGRSILVLDEFQQRIHLEALIFSLLGTSLLTFTWGLLENAGLPEISMLWVLPLAISLWGIGQILAHRRYR